MDSASQEYYLQWIIADYTPFEFHGKNYFIATASRENRFLAERFYMSVYNDAIQNGLYDNEGILRLLYKNNIWNDEREQTLDKLTKDVEEIKVNLYENYTKPNFRRDYQRALIDTENYISRLLIDKQSLDIYNATQIAEMAKQHFLMGSSIFRRRNKPSVARGDWWLVEDDEIVQHCYKITSQYLLSQSDYRELARCNSWRNLWNTRKAGGSMFGKPVVDLSNQQKQLIMWTNVYDNVYKNSECPPDFIIEDDDALDGWMIKQRRIRDKETNRSNIEHGITNEKIRNANQVYIMCDPSISEDVIVDNPSKVYELNDINARMRLKNIMNQIQKEGCVSYMGLKDTQAEIYKMANEIKG